jgi:pSer/pThr/pTyr-binding forkhead associated (FHA) protein
VRDDAGLAEVGGPTGPAAIPAVLLDDPAISCTHLKLRLDFDPDQAWLTDLSTNGTRINGQRIERSVLLHYMTYFSPREKSVTSNHTKPATLNVRFRLSRQMWLASPCPCLGTV